MKTILKERNYVQKSLGKYYKQLPTKHTYLMYNIFTDILHVLIDGKYITSCKVHDRLIMCGQGIVEHVQAVLDLFTLGYKIQSVKAVL